VEKWQSEYFITETKFGGARLGKNDDLLKSQMTDKWLDNSNRLERSVGRKEARKIQTAMDDGQVEKRLLHIDTNGKMNQYTIDKDGKTTSIQ
jgi:hypothetical protein